MARLISLIQNTYGIQILDSHDTYEDFIEEHPTGNAGDAHIVDGNIYTWSAGSEEWIDGGQIVGPQGQQGIPGPQGIQGTPGQDALPPVEVTFVVQGGTAGVGAVQPTFNGAPLFSGSYVKFGPLVTFQVQVDFDNITSFGSGQYYINLPFPAKHAIQFSDGCAHDISTGRDYIVSGHVISGSSQMLLKSIDAQGNSAFDVPFTATSPFTLNAADNFHVSGTYIDDDA